MPTIREIAKEAGVSSSTVSIVLNGKSEERKIPQITQKKIMDAARKLNYHPNVAARRLRIQPSDNLIIAVFWASDFRAPMMVRFLQGLQQAILKSKKNWEVIIHPYQNNKLNESMQALEMCNAAVICNASIQDMRFLEHRSFPVPTVLYNRHSDKFCTVNVDDNLLGAIPAKVFADRGHKNAGLVVSKSVFPGMDVRVSSFLLHAEKAGIAVRQINQENSMEGGYRGGESLCTWNPMPDCLFCTSDMMAIGAMKALLQAGVRIPEDMEIISVGNGERELEEYACVSLSVVHLPMEKMAEACFELVLDLMAGKVEPPYSVELPVKYITRDSCGGSADQEDAAGNR